MGGVRRKSLSRASELHQWQELTLPTLACGKEVGAAQEKGIHPQIIAQERSPLRRRYTGEEPAWAAQPCQVAYIEEK